MWAYGTLNCFTYNYPNDLHMYMDKHTMYFFLNFVGDNIKHVNSGALCYV